MTLLEQRLQRQLLSHPVIRNERAHCVVEENGVSFIKYRGGWELRCPAPECDKVIGYRHDQPPTTYDHGHMCTPCAVREQAELSLIGMSSRLVKRLIYGYQPYQTWCVTGPVKTLWEAVPGLWEALQPRALAA